MQQSPRFLIRRATEGDVTALARHRVGMFRDMGSINADLEPQLHEECVGYFTRAIAAGEYFGWVVCVDDSAAQIVAGGGVQVRAILPRPDHSGGKLLLGREGLVLNVYVEPDWRRRGLARRLMEEILHWAAAEKLARVVLHASPDGRPLYESMGFVPTNEMRYGGTL